MFNVKIFLLLLILIINPSIILAGNGSLYSFTDVHVEKESIDSLSAKEIIINEIIQEKFEILFKNLSINEDLKDYNFKNDDYENFLKNLVIKNEIVTEKKYIADLEIHFSKDKIINYYKKNKILFSDTESPDMLVISGYNFDGSDILWEINNWNDLWSDYINLNSQLNLIIPNSDNINKILLSPIDIFKLNLVNIEKILNYYELDQSIIITAYKYYDNQDSKIYINLLITYYNKDIQNLEKILSENILVEKSENNLLDSLTIYSHKNILEWWKNKTITHFNKENNLLCNLENIDIKSINKIKDKLISISQVDKITPLSIQANNTKLKIYYFGNLNEITDIFKLYGIKINFVSEECFLSYESV